MDPNTIAQAALGALSQDAAFTARFGEAPSDDPKAPAETPPAKAEAKADQPDTGSPEPRVFAGKYPSVEELEKGALEGQSFITQLQRENAELRARVTATPTPSPEPEPSPFAEIEQYGVPADLMERAVNTAAAKVVSQFFAPMVAINEVENDMRKSVPGYAQHAGSLEEFIKGDEQTARIVGALGAQGLIREAKLVAFDRFKIAKAAEIEAADKARAAADAAKRSESKADAGVAPTASGQGRSNKDPRTERMAQNLRGAIGGDNQALGRYAADIIGLPEGFGQLR